MKKKIIFIIILLMCIGTATYSLINVITWKKDNNHTDDIINEIIDNTDITKYTDVNNLSIIDVKFDYLQNINTEVIGWLTVENTNINYPIVQTKDNSFYLNHSFDKSINNAGWPFLDYRNDINNLDKNNIIYAHSRKDKTMFGSLFNILSPSWYKNEDNHYINLSTKNENTLWQIFSIYIIDNETYYIKTNFNNSKEYLDYINTSLNRSIYNFNVDVNLDDTILTLSTCKGNYKKLVVQSKLIKKETKLE